MPDTHVMVSFERTTHIPKDRIINTFSVNQFGPAVGAVKHGLLAQAFIDFYNVVTPGQPLELGKYLSPNVSRVAGDMKVALYNIPGGGAPMGSPFYVKTAQLTTPYAGPGAGDPIPDDVAVVMSLESVGHDSVPVEGGVDPVTGKKTRPRSRHKGRTYFGPLVGAAVNPAAGFARPHPTLIAILLASVAKLRDGITAAEAAADLAVWSRKDDDVRSVNAASVDNEFDTQRRRGTTATARTRVLL